MKLMSYAQNFEDVILWRALQHVENGFYIDIGANDPVVDSVSQAFYEKGWRGVHVEPMAEYAQKLRGARPDEEVIETAIGPMAGSIKFYEIAKTGLSTGCPQIAEDHNSHGYLVEHTDVSCLSLSQLLDRYSNRVIHWLKIDVEGMENQVIESWSPSLVRPWVVVVESTVPTNQEPSYFIWEPKIVSLGYEFVYFDGVNRFYVNGNQLLQLKDLFGPGPNFFDDFAVSATSFYARALSSELANRDETICRLQEMLSQRETEVVSLGESKKLEIQEREEAQTEIARLNADIKSLHLSISWQLTKPIRWVESLTRRILDRRRQDQKAT